MSPLPQLALCLLLLAGASAQRAPRLSLAVQSDGTFLMAGPEPVVLETGRVGVDFLKEALNVSDDSAIVDLRSSALDYFAASLGFEIPEGALDGPVDAPVVLGACAPEDLVKGCVPTTVAPYMSVLSLRSFAVARSDMALEEPARLTDGGFQFAAGTAGFQTARGLLRLPERGFFGVQRVAFPNETLIVTFRTRELVSFESNLYDFEAEAGGYGAGSVGGAFRIDILGNGTGRYRDWMVGTFG